MTQITTITDAPNQNIVITLGDGTTINLTLNFYANQSGWFYSLSYNSGAFIVNNRRLVTSPNMLSQFQNIIPFGIAVTTTDGYEPIYIDDFITKRASFYVLTADDVALLQSKVVNVQ